MSQVQLFTVTQSTRIPLGSLLYLISAACILYGVDRVIEPMWSCTHGIPLALSQRLSVVGALNVYELTLLGAAVLILLWKRVTGDAVALVVLMAAFLVGSAVAINTVAPDRPTLAMILGGIGIVLATGKGLAIQRFVTGAWALCITISITLLAAWNLLIPGFVAQMQLDQVGHDTVALVWWLSFWLVLIAAMVMWIGIALIPAGVAAARNAGKPFIRRTSMQWWMIVIIFTGSITHLYALAWVYQLPLSIGDYMPAVMLLVLIRMEALRALGRLPTTRDHLMVLSPLVMLLIIVGNRAFSEQTLSLPGAVSYPPIAAMMLAFALGVSAWVAQRYVWFVYSGIYSMFTVITFGITPHRTEGVPWIWRLITDYPGWFFILLSFVVLGLGIIASAVRGEVQVPTEVHMVTKKQVARSDDGT